MLWERCWLLPFKNHGGHLWFSSKKKWHHGHRKKKHDTSYPPFVVSWTCLAESLFAHTDTWLVYDHHLTFQTFQVSVFCITITRWWFQTLFIFIPISGRFPIWLIFFRWGETTNQMICVWWTFLCIWRCVTFYFEEPFPKRWSIFAYSNSEFWEFTKTIALLVIQLLPQPKSGMYIYIYIWHPWIDHMFLIILLDMLHVVGFRDQGVFFHRIFIRAFSLRWLEQDGDLQQSLMIRQGWEGKLILIGKMLVPLGWYL